MKAIEIRNLKKTFNGKTVLENLTLDVEPGEVFGMLGPNGAGKTTTIRTILTLLKPTEGRVMVWGYDVETQPREVRQVLGYVPQEKAVDRFLTGREHLILVADLYHLSKAEAQKRIREVLELVDLSQKADDLVTHYSGGMKKKLDIACGLIPDPKVLVLDEPTLGLDVESRIRIWEYIRRLQRGGLTILMTTNYLDEADQLCDRIAILDRGRLVSLGAPEGLKKGLGGDRVTIQFGPQEDRLEELAGRLKKELPFVNEIKVSPGNHELEIRVTSNEEALAPLIQKIHEHRHPILAIQYSRPTLEDVFITSTGHKIKEDSALL
ncbi:MAG TPA: ATP-binding cassette domain-containing protein [Nitrospiria bacterium]|nr:ATP-binding cassette domain-containing protein [Nitrospiria bacterium]